MKLDLHTHFYTDEYFNTVRDLPSEFSFDKKLDRPDAPPDEEKPPLLTHYLRYSTQYQKRFASSLLH